MNIGIEATIVDVYKSGSNISLAYIDRSGKNQTVTDFGYQGFVQLVFDYLMSCKVANQRAVFILTYKSDMKMRLAADTMMLGTYVNLWRNKPTTNALRPSAVLTLAPLRRPCVAKSGTAAFIS
jgi:hypothetical protein